ncbi:linear amide C-N hydrolase [Okeania sp. SIO1H2]|uniref:linear amide C-N hydrolase n=2 Tax=Okeania TaxID=1458928 RepID=UPI00257E56D9|nr:linear amide C-N hydrolase [Okeania sp. SIO1H2]
MTKKYNFMKKLATVFVVLITILSMVVMPAAQACSRLVYQGSLGPITARSMDWFHDPEAELWFFPAGIDRTGGAGPNSIGWKSKYGSIITSSYDIATVDGINDQGLVANLLFLAETDYGDIRPCDPTLSVGGWGQYVLDNYANVAEAVEELEKKSFKIVTTTLNELASSSSTLRPGSIPTPILLLPDGHGGTMGDANFALHMALSDRTGDSAIIEYLGGEMIVHHKKTDDENTSAKYNVLTNDPTFEEQLAINSYWNSLYANLEGTIGLFLPGTSSPSDRFIRASYYLDKMGLRLAEEKKLASKASGFILNKDQERRSELAAALGIIRNVSDPIGLDGFGIGTTQWRTLANQSIPTNENVSNDPDATYFFEFTENPSVVWANINKLAEKGVVSNLDSINNPFLSGNVSELFVEQEDPFSWDISCTLNNSCLISPK